MAERVTYDALSQSAEDLPDLPKLYEAQKELFLPDNPLSENGSLEDAHGFSSHTARKRGLCCRLSRFLWLLSCFANAVLLGSCIWLFKHRYDYDPSLTVYTPAREAVRYTTTTFTRGLQEDPIEYQGWPTDESDKKWNDLWINGIFLSIDAAKQKQMANSTIRVPYEGQHENYMVGISMHHQLHCIDRLRMAFHPERYGMGIYYQNGTANEEEWFHHSHCLDYLRQVAMCHADPHTFIFAWNPGKRETRLRFDVPRTCRSYDALNDWAKEHNLGKYDNTAFYSRPGDVVPLDFGP